MSRILGVAVPSLLLLAASALACAPAPKRQAHWVTTAGAPADREAVRAAADACESKAEAESRPGRRRGTVEWGVAMLDCLRESGYVLIYEDPAQIPTAD